MQEPNPKIDAMFKKVIVFLSVGMFVIILIALTLYFFRGPSIRDNLATLIEQEKIAIEFNSEASKAGLSGKNANYAVTVNSVLNTMVNEQYQLSGNYGRALTDKEVSIDTSTIENEIDKAKAANRVNEFYSEQIDRLLQNILAELKAVNQIEQIALIDFHISQIDALLND